MNVISSSFKAPGVWLPGLKPRFWCSYVTSGQTAVQKELCSMSHEKRGLPCPALQFCLAGLLVPCPGQAVPQQCWHLSAADLCGAPSSCWHQTRSAHHEQVRRLWGQSLAIMSPSLAASLSSSAVGWPWSLEQSALDRAWWNSAVSSAAWRRRIESYLDCILEESSFKSVWFVLISLSKYYGKVSLGQIKIQENIIEYCVLSGSLPVWHILIPFQRRSLA